MTRYEAYNGIGGSQRPIFDNLQEAEEYMAAEGMEYIDSAACDHPTEERRYYLPIGEVGKYFDAAEAFSDLYGDGYEPCITPIED